MGEVDDRNRGLALSIRRRWPIRRHGTAAEQGVFRQGNAIERRHWNDSKLFSP